jgi:CBS domain-containing protein
MEHYLIDLRQQAIKLENAKLSIRNIDKNTLIIKIFTDFRKNEALFVRPETLVDDALNIMKIRHVRNLFILTGNDEVIGVITSRILSDVFVLEYMAKHNVRSRKEVQVADIMLSKENLHALSYDDLLSHELSIKNIIEMFCNLHERHIFVVDKNENSDIKIIGIISAADIARALNINLDPELETLTFSSLANL